MTQARFDLNFSQLPTQSPLDLDLSLFKPPIQDAWILGINETD